MFANDRVEEKKENVWLMGVQCQWILVLEILECRAECGDGTGERGSVLHEEEQILGQQEQAPVYIVRLAPDDSFTLSQPSC